LSKNTSSKFQVILHPFLAFPEFPKMGERVYPVPKEEIEEPGVGNEEPEEPGVGENEPGGPGVGKDEAGELDVCKKELGELVNKDELDIAAVEMELYNVDDVICAGQCTKTVFALRLIFLAYSPP
jgi:hypothetical protein